MWTRFAASSPAHGIRNDRASLWLDCTPCKRRLDCERQSCHLVPAGFCNQDRKSLLRPARSNSDSGAGPDYGKRSNADHPADNPGPVPLSEPGDNSFDRADRFVVQKSSCAGLPALHTSSDLVWLIVHHSALEQALRCPPSAADAAHRFLDRRLSAPTRPYIESV